MLDKFKKYLKYLLYIIIAETILGGAGRVITFGALSLRMGLYGIALLLFLICLILDKKKFTSKVNLKDLNIKLVILFLLWAAFTALHGYLLSGYSLSQIKGDVTGFISLILIFPMCYVFDDKRYINTIAKLVSTCVVIQSLIIILIYFGIEAGLLNFDYMSLGITGLYLGNLAKIQPNTTRIFFKSSIFIQVGILILLGMLQKEPSAKNKWKIYLSLILECFALILSFTRGFWLAAAVSILIYVILKGYKKFIKPFFIITLGILILIGINYGINRNAQLTVSIASRAGIIHLAGEDINDNPEASHAVAVADKSSNYRENLKGVMISRIKEKPIIGTGFGVVLTEIGQEVSHSEYMYLDIMLEMGLVGFILYISIFFLLFIRWLSIRKNIKIIKRDNYLDEFFIGFLSIIITSSFNPFLNNPIGIMFLAIVFSSINVHYKEALN